uniref:RNase H type-1 domain-containing protein n=1 Tax=Cannabis sativa TaxID=3483 RepID=A0A803NY05_CANSA
MLCWSIWRTQNDLIFKKSSPTIDKVVSFAKLTLDQWISAQHSPYNFSLNNHTVREKDEQWTKSSLNMIEINVDGDIFSQSNIYGFRCIARDHEGDFIEAFQSSKPSVVNPEFAEAVGIKEALSWIKSHGWSNVMVETNCVNVVHAIKSKVRMYSPNPRIKTHFIKIV